MDTPFEIDDGMLERLRRESARTGRSVSQIVEDALRLSFARLDAAAGMPPLQSFESGGALADLADREALYRVMDGR